MTKAEQEKIKLNREEEIQFASELEKLLEGDLQTASRPLRIGVTPNVLVICGARKDREITITKKVIDKAMRTESRDAKGRLIGSTGHGLTKEQLVATLQELKCPLMIFQGNKDASLLVLSSVMDDKERIIVIAVSMEYDEGFETVNSIRSIYGRDNLKYYINEKIDEGKLLAVNKEKADDVLRSIEKSYLKENAPVCFDNTVAYTLTNVKSNKVWRR